MNTQQPELTLTRAMLNTPPFIKRILTAVVMISIESIVPVYDFSFTDFYAPYGFSNGYLCDESSAIMLFNGKTYKLTSQADKNKITLRGIRIPPRGKVLIFYRLHKFAD